MLRPHYEAISIFLEAWQEAKQKAEAEPVKYDPCGFAWLEIKANSPENRQLIDVLRIRGYARKSVYKAGYTIWISDYGQSMTRKEVHAQVLAARLREAGYVIFAYSRMD